MQEWSAQFFKNKGKAFETLEMKPGENVSDYFSRVMSAWWADERCNSGREDSSILAWPINYIVCSIKESKDIDEFSLDEL